MLVGSSMKHDCRMVAAEQMAHAGGIENVGDERQNDPAITTLDQFLLDEKDLNFGLLHKQEALGIERGNLAAEFRANAAAGPGDHDDAAAEQHRNVFCLEFDWFPTEQILNFNVA